MTADAAALLEILERGRELGFLGPGPVGTHVEHARALARVIPVVPERYLDLGSGGGIPGLVVALDWPTTRGVLLDAQERRCRFLEEAVVELGLEARIEVVEGRAEELARRPNLRGMCDLVLARSFASPPVTAECAAGFLRIGGRLVVSEPPEDPSEERWPEAGLEELGYGPATVVGAAGVHAAVMELRRASDRWPRRTGVPAKRPQWRVR